MRAVEAHGKHLFARFEGDLTLHDLDPWRRLAEVTDDEALRIVRLARAR